MKPLSFFKKTPEERYKQFIQRFRERNIPERYNQIKLLDELTNTDLDYYISISNRSDGKSYNYLHAVIQISLEFDLGFTLLSRNYSIRESYQELIYKIVNESKQLKIDQLEFINTRYYMSVIYGDRIIGVVTYLTSATNLKYSSNLIQDFPIIVYDEFLAIQGDYLPDEWVRLKTIYSSIDRGVNDYPLIKFPKIILLGNAVNFSSPILSELDLFNKLENHPINQVIHYDNILLEMNRNDKANDNRNLRAFKEHEDNMTMGQFDVNTFNIATEEDRSQILYSRQTIIVKLADQFLKIDYNDKTYQTILSIIGYSKSYDYNLYLADNKDTSIFLKDSYFSSNHSKKYLQDTYLFDNNFTKDFILNDNTLTQLKIMRLIQEDIHDNSVIDPLELNEEKFEQNYIDETMKSIRRKFFNE